MDNNQNNDSQKSLLEKLINAAEALFEMDRYQTANAILEEALDVIRQSNLPTLQIPMLIEASRILERASLLDESLFFFQEAERISNQSTLSELENQVKDRMDELEVQLKPIVHFKNKFLPKLNQCERILNSGQSKQATQMILDILVDAKKSEEPEVIIQIILESSKLIARTGDQEQVLILGQRASKLASSMNNPYWIRKTHRFFSELNLSIMEKKRIDPDELITSLTALKVNKSARNPMVDIVIPIYGQAMLVEKCIESLQKTLSDAHIILVDDCSPNDEINDLFDRINGIPNITTVSTATNVGFIGATHLGAGFGTAPFILFLNSDIEAIEPGWLEKLVPTEPDISITGAKLLYPLTRPAPLTGTIQHAGIARNDEGIPYHPFYGWDANTPEANQIREVNAVTGACLLIRRKVWDELGGWDKRFNRGVYEDVDLCWRARQKGYRILYQPEACLYHHESASQTPDGRHTLSEHTEENLKKLVEKWKNPGSDEDIFFGIAKLQSWQKSRVQFNKIKALLIEGKIKNAWMGIKELMKTSADFSEGLWLISEALSQRGDHEQAVIYLQKLIRLQPAHWKARLLLVDEFILLGKLDAALAETTLLEPNIENQSVLIERKKQIAQSMPHNPTQARREKKIAGNPPNPLSAFSAEETLGLLLEADDLNKALNQYSNRLDVPLVNLIKATAEAARQNCDLELAEGLETLVEYIQS